MITYLFFYSFSLVSLIILIQDLKYRAVAVWLFVTYALLLIPYYAFISKYPIWDAVFNLIFIVFLFLLTWLIVMLRSNQLKLMIGKGDILFIFITSFYFPFPSFIVVMNVSLVVALVLHYIFLKTSTHYSSKAGLIPLAGFQAPIFVMALIFDFYVRPISSYIY